MNLQRLFLIYDGTPGVGELFRDLLLPVMGPERFVWYGGKGVGTKFDERKAFDLWPRSERNAAQVICGARLPGGMERYSMADQFHEMLFFREPAEFCARHYLKVCDASERRGDVAPTLDEIGKYQAENCQTQNFCKRLDLPRPDETHFDLENWKRRLGRMRIVGTADRLRDLLPLITADMGQSITDEGLETVFNAWEARYSPSDDLVAHFREANPCPIDREIYDLWSARQDEQIEWLKAQVVPN